MTDDMIKLGVLWKNVSREGQKQYLSGRVQQETLESAFQVLRDGGRLLIFSNNKRPNKQDPDCVLYVAPERDRSETHERRDSEAASRPPAGNGAADRGRGRPQASSRGQR